MDVSFDNGRLSHRARSPRRHAAEHVNVLEVANVTNEASLGCLRLVLKIGIVGETTVYPTLHRRRARYIRWPSAIVVAIAERKVD